MASDLIQIGHQQLAEIKAMRKELENNNRNPGANRPINRNGNAE
jgi:hypothetical protein